MIIVLANFYSFYRFLPIFKDLVDIGVEASKIFIGRTHSFHYQVHICIDLS